MADTVQTLLDDHGQSFADELGIPVERNQPSPLFRLLTASLLLSANIDARLGLRAATAMADAGYTTARKLADATENQVWRVLADAKYLRKERTTGHLRETARRCMDEYGGDLREIRPDPRPALLEFKGIGEVGADIFLREVQVAWTELHPYADERVTGPAQRLGLPKTAKGLAGRTDGPAEFVRLTAALVRWDLGHE